MSQSNSFPAPIFPAIDASTLQVLGLDLDAKVPQATPFLFNDAALADASADSALSSQATNSSASQETRGPRKPKSEREKDYNKFVRDLVARTLDPTLTMSQQPENAIRTITSRIEDAFPEFAASSRQKIRDYFRTRRRRAETKRDVPYNAPDVRCNISSSLSQEFDSKSVETLARGYRQSAALLIKAAEELEKLISSSTNDRD